MELILKQYDIPLLRFSATNDSSTPEIKVHWINEDQRHFLPLDMELSPEGISRWMRKKLAQDCSLVSVWLLQQVDYLCLVLFSIILHKASLFVVM